MSTAPHKHRKLTQSLCNIYLTTEKSNIKVNSDMEIVLKLGDTSLLSLLQTLFSALLIHANGLKVKVRTVRPHFKVKS